MNSRHDAIGEQNHGQSYFSVCRIIINDIIHHIANKQNNISPSPSPIPCPSTPTPPRKEVAQAEEAAKAATDRPTDAGN